MSVSMPLKPPLKPGALVTTIVLVVHAETLDTPCQIVHCFVHHVYVVLGHFMEDKGGARRRWGIRLPNHTLNSMVTTIMLWFSLFTIKSVITVFTGRINRLFNNKGNFFIYNFLVNLSSILIHELLQFLF